MACACGGEPDRSDYHLDDRECIYYLATCIGRLQQQPKGVPE